MKVSNTIGTRTGKVFSSLAPRRSPLIPLLLLLAASGCASIPFFGKSAKFEQADAKNPAVELLTLWQCTEGPGPQGVPIRGFAGQIYFFTQNKGAPVLVDGKVRIYIFDDHGTAKEQGRPIGEYDFDSASWNARVSPLITRSRILGLYSLSAERFPSGDLLVADPLRAGRRTDNLFVAVGCRPQRAADQAGARRRTHRFAASSGKGRPHAAVGDVGTVVPAVLVAAASLVAAGHRARRRHRGRHAVFAGQCRRSARREGRFRRR